jgi:sporulation protein YlmC with PRC-barrel domain
MSTKEILKKPIFSLDEGRLLGEIRDVYLNAELSKVTAVFLGKEGILFNRKTLVIPVSEIKLMGVDCWLVSSANALVDLAQLEGGKDLIKLSDIKGREITTVNGTGIGTLGDVALNLQGEVKAFSLAKVSVQGPLAQSKELARAAVTFIGDSKRPMVADLHEAEIRAMSK